MISLSIQNLTQEYDGRLVFQSVGYEFAGRSLSVTGRNGSGKSTLIRIIAGLLTPTDGQVQIAIDGSPIERENLREIIGLVAPDVKLYGELSARENLEFLTEARNCGPGKSDVERALDKVGLIDRSNDPVRMLSSGLRQRACFAAAILHNPPVLLLDEPSSNLDTEGIMMVREIINEQSKRGMVIIATNEPDEAALCEASLDLGGQH